MTDTDDVDEQVQGWFSGRVPAEWFDGQVTVSVDRDEILVVGPLSVPDPGPEASEVAREEAVTARIQGFREDTRRHRMRIADEAEARFGRKASWGVTCGERQATFTVQAIPAMTRLRMDERRILDTLVEAGVARSRSHALAWCVRLVGTKQDEWLADLREALRTVEQVREQGPTT